MNRLVLSALDPIQHYNNYQIQLFVSQAQHHRLFLLNPQILEHIRTFRLVGDAVLIPGETQPTSMPKRETTATVRQSMVTPSIPGSLPL